MKKGWMFLVWLYLFILSIELIKKTSLSLSEFIHLILNSALTPIKAMSLGWFVTVIIQSGSALGAIIAPFVANNLLPYITAVFIMMGARIGSTGIMLLISVITGVKKKRRDFRHGFEIGLVYTIYTLLTIIISFILEYFFNFFSKSSLYISDLIGTNIPLSIIPNITKPITDPIINILFLIPSKFLLLLLAFALLLLTLRFFTKSIIVLLGGEDKARIFINKYFKSKCNSFLIGLLFTMLVFSTAISITLLVPLAVSRLINLKKAIPYIIGASIGTMTDIILASLITGNTLAFAVAISYVLFAVVGALIFLPNTNFLFNLTKFISKRIMHISEKRAVFILLIFILIPLLIFLL